MSRVEPWMRLKVKSDVYFVPDGEEKVYFRNNVGSFSMEGTAIQTWIEKLFPVFNGQHTLDSLTDGLPEAYRDRIYEVAGILYENGFVRDVSTDEPHQLSVAIAEHYAPQIEFINNLTGSGAFRFQTFRNSNILVIGSGLIADSLAISLFESGIRTVHLIVTDAIPHSSRLCDYFQLHHQFDPESSVHDLTSQYTEPSDLRELIESMDAVLYISRTGDISELHQVETSCHAAHKPFLSGAFVGHVGIITRTNAGSFEDAWRRLHKTVLEGDLQVTDDIGTSSAILANVMAFEVFKMLTSVDSSTNRMYTLNIETLEGTWHEFIPAVSNVVASTLLPINVDAALVEDSSSHTLHDALSFFASITNETTGIFHVWDEGHLLQLPLSQCRVQPIDARSIGPADLLPETVCTGFTHDDARYEAGLVGVEAYAGRLFEHIGHQYAFMGVGAGLRMAEAIYRGLQHCLTSEVQKARGENAAPIKRVRLGFVHDEKCQFYLQALRAVDHEPVIGISEDIAEFKTVWVGMNGRFVGIPSISISLALQQTLAQALKWVSRDQEVDTITDPHWVYATSTSIMSSETLDIVDIEPWIDFDRQQVATALDRVKQVGKNVIVYNLAVEPFLSDILAGVVGVCIREVGA